MAAQLGLSEDQQQQIKAIHESEHAALAQLRQQLKGGMAQLRLLGQAEPFDEAAVRNLAASLAAARSEMMVTQARVQSRIRALLTPEQRAKAESMWEGGGMGWQGRHGEPGDHDDHEGHGHRGHHGPDEDDPDDDDLP